MKTIYLAGPVSDGDNPYAWHESIQAYETDIEWTNPFVIHDEDATGDEIWAKDLAEVRASDGMLLRRMGGYEVCGAYIEAGVAGEYDVPIVVWNDAETEPSEALRWHADSIHETMESAVDEVVSRV